MKKLIFIVLAFIYTGLLFAKRQSRFIFDKRFSPHQTSIYYKLGNGYIQIKTYQYGCAKDIVMINLHDVKSTLVAAGNSLNPMVDY